MSLDLFTEGFSQQCIQKELQIPNFFMPNNGHTEVTVLAESSGFSHLLKKIKSVAYSFQESHTDELDFCNWLADSSMMG